MNSKPVYVLFNTAMLLLLNNFIQLNASPVIFPNSTSICSQISTDTSEGKLLYSHSEIFGTAAKLQDVEAFKYYCTNDLILSTINMEMPNLPRVTCNTSESLNGIDLNETDTMTTCEYYTEVKAYQYKLYRFFTSQNMSNTTIVSIMYLLQSAAGSLQAIQFSNNQSFCTDFVGQEEVYDTLVAIPYDSIEAVLSCLKYRRDWKLYRNYPEVFNTSPCVDYSDEKCQLYTSLYRSVIQQSQPAGNMTENGI